MKVKDLIFKLADAAGGDNNFYDAEVLISLGATTETIDDVRLVVIPEGDHLVHVIELTPSFGWDENRVIDADVLSDEDVARAEAGETPLEREQRKLDEAGEAAHNKAMFGE
jgi:hypothetical protein